MGNACGETKYAEDGVINRTTLTNSQITNSDIQNSMLSASSIQGLTSIDAASAEKIADAVAGLDSRQLLSLASAIQEAFAPVEDDEPPATTSPELPTTIIGLRDVLLGRPSGWAKFGTYVIPLYK